MLNNSNIPRVIHSSDTATIFHCMLKFNNTHNFVCSYSSQENMIYAIPIGEVLVIEVAEERPRNDIKVVSATVTILRYL